MTITREDHRTSHKIMPGSRTGDVLCWLCGWAQTLRVLPSLNPSVPGDVRLPGRASRGTRAARCPGKPQQMVPDCQEPSGSSAGAACPRAARGKERCTFWDAAPSGTNSSEAGRRSASTSSASASAPWTASRCSQGFYFATVMFAPRNDQSNAVPPSLLLAGFALGNLSRSSV